MNSGDAPGLPIYGLMAPEEDDSLSHHHLDSIPHSSDSLLYTNLSILKDKIQELESVLSLFISPVAVSAIPTLLQEIILTASSMLFAFQQLSLSTTAAAAATVAVDHHGGGDMETLDDTASWYAHDDSFANWNDRRQAAVDLRSPEKAPNPNLNPDCDIIEIDAADLLAKYTHYCAVCGKGFKRDANLRMHMRAHGDQYKSSAALSNPEKMANKIDGDGGGAAEMGRRRRRYSCPQEGCRWNQRHARFQPLKSMICVKNHYRRSHCPKMYICKRCNGKRFSVVSDLRTHEKHCGDARWRCSCGTTFSRKDKLMGHVALFVGHAPAVFGAVGAGVWGC